MTKNNQPYQTIRDGKIAATIWRNDGEKGPFYSVEFSRTYTDGHGNPKSSNSFNASDLPIVSRLADKAYDVILDAKVADK